MRRERSTRRVVVEIVHRSNTCSITTCIPTHSVLWVLATKSRALSQVGICQLYYDTLRPPQNHRWCESCFPEISGRYSTIQIAENIALQEFSGAATFPSSLLRKACSHLGVRWSNNLRSWLRMFWNSHHTWISEKTKRLWIQRRFILSCSVKTRRQIYWFQMNSPGEKQKVKEVKLRVNSDGSGFHTSAIDFSK